jgi:hypothetical protein
MDTLDTIQTVLAVRTFQEKAVPPDVVRRIVEAGWLTGSSMNLQPWHFVVVQDRATLHRLGELARSGPYIAQAPLAIAVAIEETVYAVSDASRAIQSMMLAALGRGCWLELGWLPRAGGDQAAARHPCGARSPGDHPLRLSGRSWRQRQETAQTVGIGGSQRAFRPAVRPMTHGDSGIVLHHLRHELHEF